eukprot:6196251-Pleurochrysis_carterae.AAC.3
MHDHKRRHARSKAQTSTHARKYTRLSAHKGELLRTSACTLTQQPMKSSIDSRRFFCLTPSRVPDATHAQEIPRAVTICMHSDLYGAKRTIS